jgi:hypothetical protein
MSETLRVIIEDDDGGVSSQTPRADRQSVADLERKTSQWNAEAARLRAEAHHNHLQAARTQLDAGLRTAAAEAEAARAAYQNTLEAGDFSATAQAVEKLTEVEVRRRELEREQQALARIPAPPSDPVEAYCAGRTEPSQRWVRASRKSNSSRLRSTIVARLQGKPSWKQMLRSSATSRLAISPICFQSETRPWSKGPLRPPRKMP